MNCYENPRELLDIKWERDRVTFTCTCGRTRTFLRFWYDRQPYGFARRWMEDHELSA